MGHIEELCKLMKQYGLAELNWEKNGESVRLATYVASAPVMGQPTLSYPAMMAHAASIPVPQGASEAEEPAPAPVASLATENMPAHKKEPEKSALPPNQKQILSPFVGTFYRSPSPGAEPYVKEGQLVKKGDVLCIVEAMKLMNEIESEFTGKVLTALVDNGQPVEFGTPLFVIEI